MGNNNVTGQQVSEESAKGFEETIDGTDWLPGLDNINDKEKDHREYADVSESLKGTIISNGGGEQMALDQSNLSTKNKDLDEKNRCSHQDHTSMQDDDQNINLPTEQGDETQEDNETETTTNSTEKYIHVSTTIEDMASSKDTSPSNEKLKQLVHETAEGSEQSTLANPHRLLQENIEGPPGDEKESWSQEVAVMCGNLPADTVESLQETKIGVSTVDNLLTPWPIQGESTSLTESIISGYLDAETKEIVIKDEPGERDNSSYVRAEDGTNQEKSKKHNAGIPEEKQAICEMRKSCETITSETVIEMLEEDKKIHGLENHEEEFPKCSAFGALDIGQVVSIFQSSLTDPSATNGKEFQNHELKKSIAATGQMTDSVSARMEHNLIEKTNTEQDGTVDKAAVVKNLAEDLEPSKKFDGVPDLVSLLEVNGKDFTSLYPPLSDPFPILNEEKVQKDVMAEELAVPMTASALQLVQDSVKKGYMKHDSSDNNEAKTTDTQDTVNISQCAEPQQILLEEPEVVKFEDSETLSICTKLYRSTTGLTSCREYNMEREGAYATAECFTSESSQEKVTGTAGFTPESKQMKVITHADKATEEWCLFQKPSLGRAASEEIPLLQNAENFNSLSYSSEQHIKVAEDIPMKDITLMQSKDEAEEEPENSPLLGPREPSEGTFRALNHSARNNKPLTSLMTEDQVGTLPLLKEQEHVQKKITTVSSPRSKERKKSQSSIFASCICCASNTN
ncbi:uncharacterized protein LOC112270547 isoform X1 [Brachypodium distachyon]|uniref:Uncharacterized protein n=1 Tax=Brachypodium distachyon TaxID=15368 RepID=A0A0Q3KG32_BRADI|nr:uncharacterized protein LOC112270547 isoform X1 [Brachypodium distachyon]KQK10001.1 hypothetical protein BRADI_2g51463v3 [Brachypodium distachyon]|eukprot:XP_024313963.1 uncharacterized protein LOC112270547 isoform X1 [Brachypodium distachyon]